MSIVVIGDIGGHTSVLEEILRRLGVDDEDRLPPGLTVIQVGDLVRAAPAFRERNTQIARRMDRVLAANSPDRWIQLAGNHECAALGGPAKPDWDVGGAYEPECVDLLERWWSDGRMILAHALEDTLVTHAGLTRARWREIGAPDSPESTAARLNEDVGRPLAEISLPGRLVTGEVTPAADTMWAEVNDELLLPWLEHDDMPFDQVHGHASPFHWSAGTWWPETPAGLREATDASTELRRSTTTLGSGRTLTSIDWTLENDAPRHLWPLYCPVDSGDLRTRAESPGRWLDPGILFSVSDASTGAWSTLIGGPRARVAVWEQRWRGAAHSFLPSIDRLSAGDPDVFGAFHDATDLAAFSFELDLSWSSPQDEARVDALLEEFLPPRLVDLVRSLPPQDGASINENRSLLPGGEFEDLDVRVIDLPVNSLPSTRQRTRPLVLGTRWVRLILLERGLIALWHPAQADTWPPDRVAWPHTAVPSRSRPHLDRLRSGPLEPGARQSSWAEDTVAHERYFCDSWFGELEFWQDAAFAWLTRSLTLEDVTSLREELGLLSHYVPAVRWAQRAIVRRSREAALESSYPGVAEILERGADALERVLPEMRRRLTESFEILATVSQRVQEDEASKARASTERLNWLITLFTAVLFVPTVVSGVYGANIASLSDGARGTVQELLILMAGFALASYGLLSLATRRWGESALGLVCGVLVIGAYEVPLRLLGAPVSAWWGLIPCAIFAVSMLVLKRSTKESDD